ncbi:MAG: hypothetical protein ABWY04_19380 [Arthrobacter sp.]
MRLTYLTLDHLVREGAARAMDPEDVRQCAAAALEAIAAAAAAAVPAREGIAFLRDLVPPGASDLLGGDTAPRALG